MFGRKLKRLLVTRKQNDFAEDKIDRGTRLDRNVRERGRGGRILRTLIPVVCLARETMTNRKKNEKVKSYDALLIPPYIYRDQY